MSGVELVVTAAVVFVAGVVGVIAASIRVGRNTQQRSSYDHPPEAPPVLWPTAAPAASTADPEPPPPLDGSGLDPEATVPPSAPHAVEEATVPHQPPPPLMGLDPEATVPPPSPAPDEPAIDPEDEPALPPEPAPPTPHRPRPWTGADSLGALPRLSARVDRVEEPSSPWVRPKPEPPESLPVPSLADPPPTSPPSRSAPEPAVPRLAEPAPAPFPTPPPAAEPMSPAAPAPVRGPSILSLLAPPPRGRVLRQLPDCLDLVVTCLEGGMAIDLALQRTSEQLAPAAPELCAELRRLRADQAAGLPRAEALARLRRRCPVEPLLEFLAAADQAATVGTEIASGLARQAVALRRAEAARVEAWARRLPTAVMLAAFVFLVPPVFVLLLGSSVLSAIRAVGTGL